MSRKTERIGRSGEYLACSVIAGETDTVTVMPHGAAADVVFEWENKMYRCQVKTVTHIEKGRISWRFDLRKGSGSNCRIYKENTIDVYALVNLKYQNIYFVPFADCKKGQLSINDDIMESTNSIKSLHGAMESIMMTDISRMELNLAQSNPSKQAING